MIEWIRVRINKKYQAHKIRQEQSFYSQMLKGVSRSGTEAIFNQGTLAWLIVIVTVFLQIISLATTFEGSKVYFGGVALPFGLSAPFLFALSVQLIVFCMSHTIRKHFKAWLVLILVLATLCSTYFSYVGIYNHIHSPIDYLEERYKQIYGNITDQYQLVRDESSNGMKSDVFKLIATVSEEYTALTKQSQENAILQQKVAEIKVDSGKINAQTSSLRKPNINNYGENLDQYYADMAKYNAAVGNMITDTTKQDADLKNQLYDNEVKSVLGGKTREEFVAQSISVQTRKEQLEKVIESMYGLIGTPEEEKTLDQKLMEIQNYVMDYIVLGSGDEAVVSTLLTQLHTQAVVMEKGAGFETFKEDLNYFMLLNQKDTIIMKSLDHLRDELLQSQATGNARTVLTEQDAMLLYTMMQTEIKSAVYMLNQTNYLAEEINLLDPDYVMHNLYVLPIKNLLESGDSRAMAWFSLSFAVLIDGLTLLFALMEGREKTPLYAKSNKDVTGKSKEAIEELLIATLITGQSHIGQKDSVKEALRSLKGFLKSFEIISEGIGSGYAMYCRLDKLDDHQVFVAILCQFNLASILQGAEINIKNQNDLVGEEKYVLLRTKFIIWANQKVVELGINQEYIESLHDLEQDYIREGEKV